MRRFLSILCLTGSCLLSGAAFGQLPDASGQPGAAYAPNAARQVGAAGGPALAWLADGQTPPSGAPKVERLPPVQGPMAVPPPDPQRPRWGDYLHPPVVPLALPPLQYDLVGPPRGVLQQSEKQDYRRTLGEPSPLLYQDSQMLQAVSLYRPDGLAPAGVFNDHTLISGRTLVSYRYLQSSFDDLFVNSRRVSFASVEGSYKYVPTRMFQDSQVALLEYGLTDDFTFTAMLPFQHNLIDYASAANGNLATGFTNPGDIRLQALYVVRRRDRQQQHVSLGLSVPVGLLEDAFNETPSATVPNLPYALRTSSGTYDLLLGYTIRGQWDNWSWGAQANGTIRTGINTLNYKLGNTADLTAWLSRRWSKYVSTSARLDGQAQGNIIRQDARLNQTLAPTNRPDTFGYERINALFGINFYLPDGRIPGQRLSIEAGLPIFQSMEGPQPGLDWILNAGWNMIF